MEWTGALLIIQAASLALCLATIGYNGVLIRRYYRRLHHADVLDTLLMDLCVQAFTMHNQPIWQAWTQTMGTIKVQVQAARDWPAEYTVCH